MFVRLKKRNLRPIFRRETFHDNIPSNTMTVLDEYLEGALIRLKVSVIIHS